MHLIACDGCRRQYDVTNHPENEHVLCVCGQELTVLHREAHAPNILRCASCGGLLDEKSGTCEYCGSQAVVEERRLSSVCPQCFARMAQDAKFCMECGVKIEPQAVAAVPKDSACPRCKEELRSRSVEPASIIECSGCAGMWLAPVAFENICKSSEQQASFDRNLFKNPERMKRTPEPIKFRYLACIVCKDFMVPKNFGKTSGILIDVCREHGIWLDFGELERVVKFITEGGLTAGLAECLPNKNIQVKANYAHLPTRKKRFGDNLVGETIEGIVEFFSFFLNPYD